MPIRLTTFRPTYKHGKYVARKLTARITIEKGNLGNPRRGVFVACITVGHSGQRGGARVVKQTQTCDEGRNPRLALARAFEKLAQQMKWRGEHGRGAFARYKGRK